MSGKAAGRIPPIKVNSVHQRSLSRSSTGTGSVPNSPKTHEIFHFDELSPVRKQASEGETTHNGVAEHDNAEHVSPVEKAAEEPVVRMQLTI